MVELLLFWEEDVLFSIITPFLLVVPLPELELFNAPGPVLGLEERLSDDAFVFADTDEAAKGA